jgi:hypothetical protein
VKESGKKPISMKRVRAYEAYWVDDQGGGLSLFAFLSWFVRSVFRPFFVLFSSWRNYPALRLYHFHRFIEPKMARAQAEKVERLYRDFESWECRKKYRNGSFREFLQFLDERTVKSQYGNFLPNARLWRQRFMMAYVLRILRNSLLILIATSALITLLRILMFAVGTIPKPELGGYEALFQPVSYVGIAALVVWLVWISVRDKFSDVITWTLDAESDERFAVKEERLKKAQSLIREVISDDNCESCVIVGHSLGTAIAVEALLREGQRCEAKNLTAEASHQALEKVKKVRFIFAVGSPIDNIFSYFHESKAISHRFSRLVDQQRLSLSLPPFMSEGKILPTRLINFWSRFDPISGPIFSLRKKLAEPSKSIANIEVLPPGSPRPLVTHVNFFRDPIVVKSIYWAIMIGELPAQPVSTEHPADRHNLSRASFVLFLWLTSILCLKIAFFGGDWYYWIALCSSAIVCTVSGYFRRLTMEKEYLCEEKSYLGT